MKSDKGRILTLVVEFSENKYPRWILDAHLNGPRNGVYVRTICEGDWVKDEIGVCPLCGVIECDPDCDAYEGYF